MKEERLRILQMVADGKVDPEEADGLLLALDPPHPAIPVAPGAPLPPMPPMSVLPAGGVVQSDRVTRARAQAGDAQRVHIVLHGEDGDEADVTCPIALSGVALHLLPEKAREVLEKFGLELEPIMERLAHGVPTGNLLKARTEDGDQLQINLE